MPNAADITSRRLTPDLLDDYLAFFDDRAFTDNEERAGCCCFFPGHDPETTDWETRTAEADRGAIMEAVESGRATASWPAPVAGSWAGAMPRRTSASHNWRGGDGMARMEAAPMAAPKTAADRHRGTVELYEAASYKKIAEPPSGTPLMERKP